MPNDHVRWITADGRNKLSTRAPERARGGARSTGRDDAARLPGRGCRVPAERRPMPTPRSALQPMKTEQYTMQLLATCEQLHRPVPIGRRGGGGRAVPARGNSIAGNHVARHQQRHRHASGFAVQRCGWRRHPAHSAGRAARTLADAGPPSCERSFLFTSTTEVRAHLRAAHRLTPAVSGARRTARRGSTVGPEARGGSFRGSSVHRKRAPLPPGDCWTTVPASLRLPECRQMPENNTYRERRQGARAWPQRRCVGGAREARRGGRSRTRYGGHVHRPARGFGVVR